MYTGSLGTFSNRETWIIQSPLVDESGVEIDLSAATFNCSLTAFDTPETAILTANLGNGKVTLPTTTSFQIKFPVSDVSRLTAGQYKMFLTVTINGDTTQVLAVDVPVTDGGPV